MDRVKKIENSLIQLKNFFLEHNEVAWFERTNRTLYLLEKGDDVNKLLYNYVGVGMGSLLDLVICKPNGHTLHASEKEVNENLEGLIEQLLVLKNQRN